ncbi:MAG: hypothetical protein J6T62_10945 [Fibrobacter sp.]|nr:hypothetical protein [Fibrobacter sp.]
MTIKKWTYAVGFTAGLALVACSGENGSDGAPGVDGTSCVAKALEDSSGFEMYCGDELMGVIKNGEAGAAGKDGSDGKNGTDGKNTENSKNAGSGKDGSSCTVKSFKGGYKVLCGGDSVGVLMNGVDGDKGDDGEKGKSAYELAVEAGFKGDSAAWIASLKGDKGDDGEKGKSAYELAVEAGFEGDSAEWVASLKGDQGESCTLTDNHDGTVTVACGTVSPITISKAMCGKTAYDPAEKFCVGFETYPLCEEKQRVYDPTKEFCRDDDKIETLCNGTPFASNQKCEDGVILTRCGATGDTYYDSTKAQCIHSVNFDDKDLVFGKVKGGTQSNVDETLLIVDGTSSKLAHYCGSIDAICFGTVCNTYEAGMNTIVSTDAVSYIYLYEAEASKLYKTVSQSENFYDPETQFCYIPEGKSRLDGAIVERCSGTTYDTTTHFCENNVLIEKCEGRSYVTTDEFCVNDKLYEICSGQTYDPETHFCLYSEITEKCGGGTYTVSQFCYKNQIYDKCNSLSYGTNPALNAPTEYDPEQSFCSAYGSSLYEGHYIYKYTVIGEGENAQTWMARDAYYRGVSYVEADPKKNFYAHYTFENAASACPTGWHLPSEKEFNTLISVVGDAQKLTERGWKYVSNGTTYAVSYNVTNEYGFSALPTGYSSKAANAEKFTTTMDGTCAYYWLSNGKYVALTTSGHSYVSHAIKSAPSSPTYAFSVRCVKDAE